MGSVTVFYAESENREKSERLKKPFLVNTLKIHFEVQISRVNSVELQ